MLATSHEGWDADTQVTVTHCPLGATNRPPTTVASPAGSVEPGSRPVRVRSPARRADLPPAAGSGR